MPAGIFDYANAMEVTVNDRFVRSFFVKIILATALFSAACGADDGTVTVEETAAVTPDREPLDLRLLDDAVIAAEVPRGFLDRVRANPAEALSPDVIMSEAPKTAHLEFDPHINCSASSCAGEYCSCKQGARPYCLQFASAGTLADGAAYIACYGAYVSGCFSSYLACKFAALLE
jgi:hypothetical protein